MKKSIKKLTIMATVAAGALAFHPTFAMESNQSRKQTSHQQTNDDNFIFDFINYLEFLKLKNKISTTTLNEIPTIKTAPLEFSKEELTKLEKYLKQHKDSNLNYIDKISELKKSEIELLNLIEEADKLTTKIFEQDQTIKDLEAKMKKSK